METYTLAQQIKKNFIAILSLVIALTSLGYNTWRNEHTERNRNTRVAAFEILKNLGELQLIVDYAHFRKDKHLGDITIGWGMVLFIKDLAEVTPSPLPQVAERLLKTWRDNSETIESDNQSVQKISEEIYQAREDVVNALKELH